VYLSHVRTHDVRADLLNLSQAAADSVALGVGSDAAQAGSIERQAFQGLALEGIQPVVLFRCLFCTDSILAFETLGELLSVAPTFYSALAGRKTVPEPSPTQTSFSLVFFICAGATTSVSMHWRL
jgi:hypothetical protein